MNNFYQTLEDLLKQNEKFVSTDGKVMRNAVYEASNKMDEQLLELLMSNEEVKETFFKDVKGTLVFDKQAFNFVINNREMLPDSYTRFKQKIGLIDDKENFISTNNNVCLSFPFKDCVLEFDSTDPNQKREEVYYNEILAHEQIDHLFDKKVLSNAVKIDKDGETKITDFNKDDNLLIKGNNLLAMYSLLPRYEGQIKLMYWDILYNTDSDQVPYADSFKHSSWLIMMKNRIEVAKKLLKEDGVLCLQCDDNEMAYLKVLCDEIFGREGVFNCIVVKMSDASGPKMAHISKKFPKLKEYIIMCKKGDIHINKVTEEKLHWDDEYKTFFDLPDELLIKIKNNDLSDKEVKEINNLLKENVLSLQEAFAKYKITKQNQLEFCKKNSYKIARSSNSSSVQKIIEELKEKQDTMLLKFNDSWIFVKTDYDASSKTPRVQYVFANETMNVPLCDLWTEINTSFNAEGGVTLKNGQKPEKLLYYVIASLSNENDFVLDAYQGSGTTSAVALKMKRKFIGIEQLDEHITLSKTRLKNVIDGEQSAISEKVNWKGGGSFVYCELKKLNEIFIKEIEEATDKDTLIEIKNKILDTGFISCRLSNAKINEIFDNLETNDIENAKTLLLDLLDKNQLYVNFCDIEDETFAVSKEDKDFTKSFYGEKK